MNMCKKHGYQTNLWRNYIIIEKMGNVCRLVWIDLVEAIPVYLDGVKKKRKLLPLFGQKEK